MKSFVTIVVIVIVLVGIIFFVRDSGSKPVVKTSVVETPVVQTPAVQTPVVQKPVVQTPAVQTPVVQTPAVQTPVVTTAPAKVSIAIANFAFNPATLTVKKGTVVTWTNQDSAPHTVTGNNAGPSSGNLYKGGVYSYTFNTVGNFNYHCAIHPSLKASVTVTE